MKRAFQLPAVLCVIVSLSLAGSAPFADQQIADAAQLRKQAEALASEGKLKEAAPLADQAVGLYEKERGLQGPELPEYLAFAGRVRAALQDYRAAETAFQRELTLRQSAPRPDEGAIVATLSRLADTKRLTNQSVAAEDLIKQALSIQERLTGASSRQVAGLLSNLANLQLTRNDLTAAQTSLARATGIYESQGQAGTIEYARLLAVQASVEVRRGAYEPAKVLLERSLAVRDQLKVGPTDLAPALSGLATVYQELGRLELAEPLHRRLLAIYDAPAAPQPLSAATTSLNLAMLNLLKGDLATAQPLYERALRIREEVLTPTHPDVAGALERIAVFHQVAGRPAEALAAIERATNIIESNLRSILLTGSEQQRLNYMTTVQENLDIALSMRQSAFGQNRDASVWAANLVLRRKGRVLDAMTTTLDRLAGRVNDADRQLLDQLRQTRNELSQLALPAAGSRPDRAQQMATLQARADDLEATLARHSRDIANELLPVELTAVQAALPADTALVEIVRYRPFDPKAIGNTNRFSQPRYAAFVLHRSGSPVWTELGPADVIDRQIGAVRRAWRSTTGAEPQIVARDLGKLVIDPLEKQLGTAKRVLVAPDGELSVVPFAALTDVRGRYLVERFEIAVLASGRDLLRAPAPTTSAAPAVIVAAPVYGQSPDAAASMTFRALPGATEEAGAIGRLLTGSRSLLGASATESAVKNVSGPRILHVATHGFFLNTAATAPAPTDGRSIVLNAPPPTPGSAGRNALLQSGLAFSGANSRQGGDGEDGILTALEAASLNLRGTELVVLSACETGLGEVRSGDGVYGLRRALTMAGAETQVMSLWQVDDAATRDLMVAFYRHLSAGDGRAASLREVQLQFLKSKTYSHPYYWAAFVVAGNWTPLRTR